MEKFWDKLNTIVILICTVVSMILAWLVYKDHSQLNELSMIAGKIDGQLILSEEQMRVQNHFDSLRAEENIYRLQILANEIWFMVDPPPTTRGASDTTAARSKRVKELKRMFEAELQNPIVLEDTIFLTKWIQFYKQIRYADMETDMIVLVPDGVFPRIMYNYMITAKAFREDLYVLLEKKTKEYGMKNLRYIF